MRRYVVGLILAAALPCVPAMADSYALVNFDTPSTDPSTYATPFATFYGGEAEIAAGGGDYFAVSSSDTHAGLGFTITIAPGFSVHEVKFVSDYDAPPFAFLEYGAIDVNGVDSVDGGGPFSPTVGLHTLDLVDPAGIRSVYVHDFAYTPDTSLSISHVEFNPSLAPGAAVTPEPPSMWLLGTALLGAGVVCRRKLRGSRA